MKFIEQLRQERHVACGSEPIPGWCKATGLCQCHEANKLIAALKRSPGAARIAERAYKLGKIAGTE